MRRPQMTSRLACSLVVVFIVSVLSIMATMTSATYVLVHCELAKTKVLICYYTTIILALSALTKATIAALRELCSPKGSRGSLVPHRKRRKRVLKKPLSTQDKHLTWESFGKVSLYWKKAARFHTKVMEKAHHISKIVKYVRNILSKWL